MPSPENRRPTAMTRRASIFSAALGLTKSEIEAANDLMPAAAMTLEGAPHLKPEHLRGV